MVLWAPTQKRPTKKTSWASRPHQNNSHERKEYEHANHHNTQVHKNARTFFFGEGGGLVEKATYLAAVGEAVIDG